MADRGRIRNKEADNKALMTPATHPQNVTQSEQDLENQSPEGETCLPKFKKFGEYLLYVILAILAAAVIAALGVFTPAASVAVLLVFIITYTVISLASSIARKNNKKNEKYKELEEKFALTTTLVSLSLLLSFIILFATFRVHSSLKHRTIYRLEVWKWLEIALVSCVWCNLWIGGGYVLNKVQEDYGYKENWVSFTNSIRCAVNCICLVIGELLVLEVAPNSREGVIIYGLALWKWIMSAVLLSCGWYIVQIITRVIVLSLETWQNKIWEGHYKNEEEKKQSKKMHVIKKYAVFMAKGLRTRINFLLFLLLIFLTWMFYVKPRLKYQKLPHDTKDALDFVIRTFISLTITAILSLVKKFLLLLWEARELYRRFTDRIFKTYMQLYFLAKIGGSELEFLSLWGQEGGTTESTGNNEQLHDHKDDRSDYSKSQRSIKSVDQESNLPNGNDPKPLEDRGKETQGSKPKKQTKQERMEKDAISQLQQILKAATSSRFISYDILKRMAKLFLDAEHTLASNKVEKLRKEWVNHTETIRESTMDQIALGHCVHQLYKCKLETPDAKCLYTQLEELDSQFQEELDNQTVVRFKTFENWMKVSHKNCSELGNTLAGAREAVSYLNRILIGFIIVACFTIWLFITRIANIELMVLLTSPVLAAAFIFGDTAKTVFQGIIFAFAVHPFDVGDICVIEGNQLEVKRIGIWKTSFYRNGNKEQEILYPNSTLISTSIVKHKCNLDLNDSVEFNVQFKNLEGCDVEDKAIEELMRRINVFLEASKDFDSSLHDVMVKDIGESIKMAVEFKHMKNFQYMTYSECLKKKNDSRSKLLRKIRRLIDEVQTEFQITKDSDL